MTDLRTFSLLDILPESLKSDPDIAAMAAALSPELQEIAAAVDEIMLWANLDKLPEPLIDLLAWQKNVDFYDASFPLEKKRELVRQSDEFKRRKGTPWAVDQVVSAAFDESQVTEWFEYGGQPYRFRITTTDRVTSDKKLIDLIRAVNAVKNKRSRLETITVRRDNRMELYVGSVVTSLKILTIKPAT
ncbi:phage tail protein I [Brevibacillus composti]|uniref:Phage tail protein I n=1 Tax=Brevibacillus composti TaxID=2796470 RepID=A0A7T5EN83_9BACL|nr:phage tail protein I [Brevibacillus composti]QQE75730.1 phage tail protein I [Brevibacillus composti]QUO42756.1 phage tail protein I [Brevibacillus composti]